MAALHAASSPACLRCLARRMLSRPAVLGMASGSNNSSSLLTLTSTTTTTVQTRGKKTGRRGDNGVVVRLLQDVEQFGQKETILRIDRGRMRNLWYPRGIADYVTTAGQAVSERDPFFGVAGSKPDEDVASSAPAATAHAALLPTVDAARAAALLDRLPPLVFARRPITAASTAIFGSVSADDVATALRAALHAVDDGSSDETGRLRVEGRDVRFVVDGEAFGDAASSSEAEATADRVKALGRWEVEIAVRGGGVATAPVRKIIEVVAQ
ncbi:hypothetical protein CMQ_4912 [Grosmannia clavigera kw1407]|uniref:Ribosomal protein L9 domain-containing protein n=1 Tax=Grosmannia clavigera (strain kw1407 / UAMH 11150) TaxID=655863 RepID=F0XUY2_GROCL|nr:uncharacterized protein CMQ_4912 [Grosmannia clavigera kw1407]EFW99060.1 hypothetical protein CMQ_4912 [Grosmannia clavigera kw1407]